MTDQLQTGAVSSRVDPPPKGLILFLHGFRSAADTWDDMLRLLKADARITDRYDFDSYSYTTKLVEWNPFARIPELKELGQQLAGWLDSPSYRGRPVTLVGHSQGGLVIQSYFAAVTDDGAAEKLRNVRQAIFFATPSEGSTIGSALRSFMFGIFDNSQERTLRVLNSDVFDVRTKVGKRIVDATTDSEQEWRVPIHAFYGLSDNIVRRPSASSIFTNIEALDGTHFSIHRPKTDQDLRYKKFAQVLLDPGGHARRFEVERYHNTVRVMPGIADAPDQSALTRTVHFAASNRDHQPFKIIFDVRRGATLRGHASHNNEAPAEERGRAEDTGTYYEFRFTPGSSDDYTVELQIENAFGAGRRNIHFHLDTYDSHVRLLSYELDLSPYLAAGQRIPADPQCRYSPERATTCEFCADIRMRDPLSISARPREGVYVWDFHEIEGGVVDIVWEIE